MPTVRDILYAFFVLVCIVLLGWFVLEAIDRLNEAFARLAIGWLL